MKRREPAERLLVASVSKAWRVQYGTDFGISTDVGRHPFYMHGLASAVVAPHPVAPVRRYLRDSFAYTPVKWRRPFQWFAASVSTSRIGLKLAQRAIFRTAEALPGANSLVVVPGNRRIRFFDFRQGTSRVATKDGFPPEAVSNEVRVRSGDGPFPPILAHDLSAGWFEEPIVDGWALPRVPASLAREQATERALTSLAGWQARSRRTERGVAYARALRAQLDARLPAVRDRFRLAVAARVIDALLENVARADVVELAETHGDFQPGNVLLARTGEVYIVDWEHAGERSVRYDELVFRLGLRAGGGVAARVAAFARSGPDLALAASLLVLEDLIWYVNESLGGPFGRASAGLVQWAQAFDSPAALLAAVRS